MDNKTIKVLLTFTVLAFLALPIIFVSALAGEPLSVSINFGGFMMEIVDIVWIVFVGLTVIMFIWAGIMFLTSTGDPKKIDTAKGAFLWGIVGIIVAIIAFSIIAIVKNAFGAGGG